jgi:3-hydroxyacyl-CoA dehydrogenase
MPLEFRQNWLGTHFFNPVRYMKLLELIPGKDTLPEVVSFFADFGERVLGKGIVYAKDTPAFIANRLGNRGGPSAMKLALELGLTVSDVDALTGSAIGRPAMGTFGLYDLVGLDIGVASTETVKNNVPDPKEKEMYTLPAFMKELVGKGILGNKTKGGFYKKVGKDKVALDLNTLEYGPTKPVQFASLDAAKKAKTLPEKLQALYDGDDKAAQFTWRNLNGTFLYAASKIPEVSDDLLNLDRGLQWGYNHEKGPFGLWNGLDLEKYVARLEAEGNVIPAWIKEMFAVGIKSFYKTEKGVEYYYSIPDKKYVPIEHKPEVIVLPELKGQNKVVKDNSQATLYDIGDGVLCLELHTKAAAITEELIEFMAASQEELAKNWEGMVIAGSGKNFCVGANLNLVAEAAAENRYGDIGKALARTQAAYLANKYSAKPVVAAVAGMALGGGCEMIIQSSAIQAAGESYIGLVEVGVGLIPAGGGVKEAVLRTNEKIRGTDAAPVDFIRSYFTNIFSAKVSTSGKEAFSIGYLRPTDGVTLNSDYLITDAKKRVLAMVADGYTPPIARPFPAFGQNNLAYLKVGTRQMVQAGYISEYDWHIACRIIDIMCGGNVTAGSMITEQYLLDLEIEVFLGLLGEQKTQDRIANMLKTGKPLRN